ncbi:hypothetical protein GOBAR_AA23685 [Gossypium barbadense]|uniref:BSD domain-containing protein n=1 Tax=Gossypium barbadense TaxID=3634 RepID=A0A2P5X0Y3_GOSBA|nr:hypothetical protein GOBAR_AA23685 [Gossypium barbadense]
MSWLARSLANSLSLDDDGNESASSGDEENDDVSHDSRSSAPPLHLIHNEETEAKGEHRSLAPEQPSDQSISRDEEDPSDPAAVAGVRDDLAEIGGTLSKMESDYFPFGQGENGEENECEEEEEDFDVVGITDEVLAFARNIAHHPETWLDFPLDPDEDLDDFDMSIAQRDHAMAIEYLAPRLAALRIELCPCHMSDSYFWKVYFVLLHSRLNKADAEILSTPQVMEARALWMKELQEQTKPETDWYGGSTSHLGDSHNIMQNDLTPSSSNYFAFETMSPRTYASEPASSIRTDYVTETHPVESTEMPFVDKPVIEEKQVSNTEEKGNVAGPSSKIWIPDFDDEEIDWPEDDGPDVGGYSGAAICAEDVEDISFSDLEDFDDSSTLTNSIIDAGEMVAGGEGVSELGSLFVYDE